MAPLRDALGNLRNGHGHGRGAERLQALAGQPVGRAQLEALEVVHGPHRLVGVDQTMVVRPETQQLDVGRFLGEVGIGVFLRCLGVDDAAARADEGQLEHLGRREAARCRSGQRPNDVDHAVARLVVELRRRAAELHGRENLDLEFAARALLHHLRPRRQHLGVAVGHRRQEMMQPQRHLRLSECRPGDGWSGERGAGSSEKLAARHSHWRPPNVVFGSYLSATSCVTPIGLQAKPGSPELLLQVIVWCQNFLSFQTHSRRGWRMGSACAILKSLRQT